MVSKRVFLALKLSPEIQQRILTWQQEHRNLPVRFPPAEHLHVTIVPPWETEDVDVLIERLRYAVSKPKFGLAHYGFSPHTASLKFDRIIYGPEPGDIHLIWLTGQAPEWVIGFRQQLLRTLWQPVTVEPFLLHVTIARFPKHLGQQIAKEYPINESLQWASQTTTLALLESRLTNPVAEYQTLAEFPLTLLLFDE